MKTAKLGAIFLISIMALAGVGASYAMWNDTLIMDVTVSTGTVSVEWSIDNVHDTEPLDKDVSSIEAVIDGKEMTVTITNAYPCITYHLFFDIHCTGSIPVHLYPYYSPPFGNWPIIPGTYALEGVSVEYRTGQGLTGGDPIDDIIGYQLHNCESVYGHLMIHFTNDMPIYPGETYSFSWTMNAIQYNE